MQIYDAAILGSRPRVAQSLGTSKHGAPVKAVVIREYGPPDVLRFEDVADAVPGPGEIRVKVHAATVNRVLDVALRRGEQSQRGAMLPLIPGVDCAGVVDRIGAGVTR